MANASESSPLSGGDRRVARLTAALCMICLATVCLACLVIYQGNQIAQLREQVRAQQGEISFLRQRNNLTDLRLTLLDAKDPAYANARVVIAWDRGLHHGAITTESMPAAPAGSDYQLWVLDPAASAPLNAGVFTANAASHAFVAPAVSTDDPGFAISLEPGGGRPALSGVILFAVAPGH